MIDLLFDRLFDALTAADVEFSPIGIAIYEGMESESR